MPGSEPWSLPGSHWLQTEAKGGLSQRLLGGWHTAPAFHWALCLTSSKSEFTPPTVSTVAVQAEGQFHPLHIRQVKKVASHYSACKDCVWDAVQPSGERGPSWTVGDLGGQGQPTAPITWAHGHPALKDQTKELQTKVRELTTLLSFTCLTDLSIWGPGMRLDYMAPLCCGLSSEA